MLRAHKKALAATKPGVKWMDVHLLACRSLAEDLKAIGCMKGDLDEAVKAGAHAMFFQCGLGHMMGYDVHDMEGLGEFYVGYDAPGLTRSTQFGLKSLRMGRALEPGFVMTVEPGIYMIPTLMDKWRAEGKFTDFLNYDVIDKFRGFGGIRVEDDVVVTETGCRILGKRIPIEMADVEALAESDRPPGLSYRLTASGLRRCHEVKRRAAGPQPLTRLVRPAVVGPLAAAAPASAKASAGRRSASRGGRPGGGAGKRLRRLLTTARRGGRPTRVGPDRAQPR